MEEVANDVNISNARLTGSAREILRNVLLDCIKISEHDYRQWQEQQLKRDNAEETGEF